MQENTDRYPIASQLSKNIFFPKKNLTSPKSFTFKYFLYRIFRPLCKMYYMLFKLRFPDTPWTSQASVIIFNNLLKENMTGLEYGSGKSTVYFASRVKHLVSIEHDKNWFEQIKKTLQKENIKNVDYRYVSKNKKPSYYDLPDIFREKHGIPKFHVRREFESYYNIVREFPENHFDFILIDGRARVECAINSIDKLKPNGILVLDNSERKRYKPIMKILKEWPAVDTTTGLTNTTFWFKP
jgi:precorrin-6B methylase 2